MNFSRWNAVAVRAAVVALCIAALPGPGSAQAPPPPAAEDAYCTVRVASVAAIDAAATTYALVLVPTVPGTATLSGSLALFTKTDERYDVPFENVRVSSGPGSQVLAYRFPQPVVITGAYVASLNDPAPGACGIVEPWTAVARGDSAARRASISKAGASFSAQNVTSIPRPDPLSCSDPDRPARTVKAVPSTHRYYARGSVTVLITINSAGDVIAAQIDRADSTVDDDPNAMTIRGQALTEAKPAKYETATFRCRHIIGTYRFIVVFNN